MKEYKVINNGAGLLAGSVVKAKDCAQVKLLIDKGILELIETEKPKKKPRKAPENKSVKPGENK